MDDWIDVDDRLPDNSELTKYHVKMIVGSMDTEEIESVVLGKMYHGKFRFISGDWQIVTHWKDWPSLSEN